MRPLRLTLAALALTVVPSAAAGQIGTPVDDWDYDDYEPAIAEYYGEPVERRPAWIDPDELPIIYLLAREAGVSPRVVMSLRERGWSWLDITWHLGVDPTIYVERLPYSSGYWRRYSAWELRYLTDRHIIDFVNLCFWADYHRRPIRQVIIIRQRVPSWRYYARYHAPPRSVPRGIYVRNPTTPRGGPPRYAVPRDESQRRAQARDDRARDDRARESGAQPSRRAEERSAPPRTRDAPSWEDGRERTRGTPATSRREAVPVRDREADERWDAVRRSEQRREGEARGSAGPSSRGSAAPSSRGSAAPSTRSSTGPSSRGSAAPSTRSSTGPSSRESAAPPARSRDAPSARGNETPSSRSSAGSAGRGATSSRGDAPSRSASRSGGRGN